MNNISNNEDKRRRAMEKFNHAIEIFDELNTILDNFLGYNTGRKYLEYPTTKNAKKLLDALNNFVVKYPDKFKVYVQVYISDTYTVLENYHLALSNLPTRLDIGSTNRWKLGGEWRLNLYTLINEKCKAEDLLQLFHGYLTKFGIKNLELVTEALDSVLYKFEVEKGIDILKYTTLKYPHLRTEKHFLFGGTFHYIPFKEPVYSFTELEEFVEISRQLIRDAENLVREEMNIPRIGEGWIAETELYYLIKKWLPQYKVIHHGKPAWIGKQHLDIYIPELSLAIEYQGAQHYMSVEYFGGEDAFNKVILRDKRKKRLCSKNGFSLIYVRENYDINELKNKIIEIRPQIRENSVNGETELP